jgi:hypothetical protein
MKTKMKLEGRRGKERKRNLQASSAEDNQKTNALAFWQL